MATEKLTKRHIDGLKPATRAYRHYDTELKGFGVQVLPSGIKSYIVEYRPDGGGRNVAKKRMTLGRVGELTPDQARTLARDRLAEVRRGTDPLSDRQTKRREMKLSEFIDQWETDAPVSKRTGRPMKELTRSYMLARLRHHVVPILGRKRVSDVTVDDINDMIRRVAKGETAKDAPSAKIYSLWPGYLERDSTDLREWAKQKEIDFHIVHSSGHASSADLYRMAQAVAPQRLLPIHTVHPERYASLSANTEIAANGEWVEVS